MAEIKYDGTICIATGTSVSSKKWKNARVRWSDFVKKLSKPIVTSETHRDFMCAPKSEQLRIKDVGGFIGGFLKDGSRNATNVVSRQLVTLDADFSHANLWWDFTVLFDCAAVLHSTHKSAPGKLRHRIIIPLDRAVTPEEYQAISRKISADLNIALFDATTYDINRLMFWPSVSSDVAYEFEFQDGEFLSADKILGEYVDWHDTTEWPTPVGMSEIIKSEKAKQEDPLEKKGIVGAFCRAYDIHEAISTFLSEVYAPAGDNRYTYIPGTTAAGLITYEDKFAYSHHGTDPASGKLCNAFDLVRIHKFGNLDTDGKDTKSFKAMEEFAVKDTATRRQIADERLAEAKTEFTGLQDMEQSEEQDLSWAEELTVNAKGEYENSASNLNLILQNDKLLKDAFRLNTFDNRRYVLRSLPWRKVKGSDQFKDVDYSGVRNYIECVYGIVASQKVDDALALEFEKKKYHPIQEYLNGLEWDGVQRVDTLLIDYFGAKDNPYTRAAIRKMLCAAIARVFKPGTKFDMALILVGPQETYKSTFIKKLGKEWFSDTFTTIQGKESFEQLQGAWIIEMAELAGLRKAEVETIKHFISKSEDQFRAAYGRSVESYKRQCVFFGTTNTYDFLRDSTGNRRFLPIDVRPQFSTKSVADDLTEAEIDQIWAEAYEMYCAGEALYMTGEEDAIAKEEQSGHTEMDDRAGLVDTYLTKLYPEDWDKRDLYDRRKWLDDPLAQSGTQEKEFVCAAEVWCECLGKDKSDMSRYTTKEINDILRTMPGWEAAGGTRRFPIYGVQKYYKRRKQS